MKESTSITMKDIARELGVSVATVSRALKDSPRISLARREMIKKYAREHNFSPNFLAESLRKSRIQPLKVIGVIVPEFTHYISPASFRASKRRPQHAATASWWLRAMRNTPAK